MKKKLHLKKRTRDYSIVITICLAFFHQQGNAQTTFAQFPSAFNTCSGVIEIASGEILVVGVNKTWTSTLGERDGMLYKADNQGNVIWSKTFGVSGGTFITFLSGIIETPDNGFLITGEIRSIFFSAGTPVVIKTNATGDTLWTITSPNRGNIKAKLTLDGNYILVGRTSFGPGSDDNIFATKIDLNGNVLWTRLYSGPDNESALNIEPTTDGGYIISGGTRSFPVSGNLAACLIKIDAVGNIEWDQSYDYSNIQSFMDCKEASGGGYIVTAFTRGYVARLDISGNIIWDIAMTTSTGASWQPVRVDEEADGGFLVAGASGDNMVVAKLSAAGALEWGTIQINAENRFQTFVRTADGGFLTGGRSGGAGSTGRINKTDSAGIIVCAGGPDAFIVSSPNPTTGTGFVASAGPPFSSYALDEDTPPLTISTLCITLPIELLSFEAKWNNETYNEVLLKWETATEVNNDYFVVERSTDAINFTPILQTPGAGNSSVQLSYQELDNAPHLAGTSYYRLKQVDYNGDFSYSQIEALNIPSGIGIISLYPVPALNNLKVQIQSSIDAKITVEIINSIGQIVSQQEHVVNQGVNSIDIGVQNQSSGFYLVRATTQITGYTTQKQFVIRSKK